MLIFKISEKKYYYLDPENNNVLFYLIFLGINYKLWIIAEEVEVGEEVIPLEGEE